jgi:hypothetical protein
VVGARLAPLEAYDEPMRTRLDKAQVAYEGGSKIEASTTALYSPVLHGAA